jgi:hypothetical protein
MEPLNEILNSEFLEVSRVRIYRTPEGRAAALIDGEEVGKVSFLRIRPLTEPDSYLSIRDHRDLELGLLHNWLALAPDSREIVRAELERRYLYPILKKILNLEVFPGVAVCHFETDRGEREVMLRDFRDNIVYLGETRLLLTDAEGNRYDIPDLEALDLRSRTFLAQLL